MRSVNYKGMSGPIVRGKPTLTKEEAEERNRQRVKAKQTIKRKWLSEYKLEKGCQDCGYISHHAALDFDHMKDKSFMIMRDGTNYSWKHLLQEVDKCEVVCSNCHRIRTYERLQK